MLRRFIDDGATDNSIVALSGMLADRTLAVWEVRNGLR
jgi:hypothetical protein